MAALLVVLSVGCSSPGSAPAPLLDVVDTSASWPSAEIEVTAKQLDADTISSDTTLSLFNEKHFLRIIGTGQGGSNHDRAFHVQLTGSKGVVLDTVLTKATFADSLDAEFLHRAGLYDLDFDFARSQSLYFNAYVGVDETDYVQPIGFLFNYAGAKKGRLLYWLLPENNGAAE